MCVIAVAETVRPTSDEVEQMYKSNDAWAGIAWRDGDSVRWSKGMELPDIQKAVENTPMPFVAHFRVPSCGGRHKELCHPFPIMPEVPLSLRGRYRNGNVLFHNGHWNPWGQVALQLALKMGKTPQGHWSDTRVMAWLASICGTDVLDFVNEKVIVFGPKQFEYFGGPWVTIRPGLICSNDYWVKRTVQSYYTDNWRRDRTQPTQVESACTVPVVEGSKSTEATVGARVPVVLGPVAQAVAGQAGGAAPVEPFRRSHASGRRNGSGGSAVEADSEADGGFGEGDQADDLRVRGVQTEASCAAPRRGSERFPVNGPAANQRPFLWQCDNTEGSSHRDPSLTVSDAIKLDEQVKAGEAAIEEVRRLNPKSFRTSGGGSVAASEGVGQGKLATVREVIEKERAERDLRIAASRRGIVIHGRM